MQQKKTGEMLLARLATSTQEIILRRTAEILQGHLPSKTSFNIFLQPNVMQRVMYARCLQSYHATHAGTDPEQHVFGVLSQLQTIAICPLIHFREVLGSDASPLMQCANGSVRLATVHDSIIILPAQYDILATF